jgi:hypothetical protein
MTINEKTRPQRAGRMARERAGTREQRWVLALTSVASLMVSLDNQVVATALPAIRVHLHASLGALEWTVNAAGAAADAGGRPGAAHRRVGGMCALAGSRRAGHGPRGARRRRGAGAAARVLAEVPVPGTGQ